MGGQSSCGIRNLKLIMISPSIQYDLNTSESIHHDLIEIIIMLGVTGLGTSPLLCFSL